LAAWRSTLTKVSTGSMHRENHGVEGGNVVSAGRRDGGRGENVRARETYRSGRGEENEGSAGWATLSKGRVSTDSRVLSTSWSFLRSFIRICIFNDT